VVASTVIVSVDSLPRNTMSDDPPDGAAAVSHALPEVAV
jgi:hypothetical protein